MQGVGVAGGVKVRQTENVGEFMAECAYAVRLVPPVEFRTARVRVYPLAVERKFAALLRQCPGPNRSRPAYR